tara:strand:- start:1361 stop:2050 length:690 start_codon:yes stop_codon:yes gene_type:complete
MIKEDYIVAVRKGTSDEQIVHEVLDQDCYKLSEWKPKRYPKFIVDVGCQVGAFSILASHLYPECSVLAFEMMQENYSIASKNLEKLENTTCFHGAVVGKNKPVGFMKNDNNTGGHKTVYEGKDSYLSESRFDADYKLEHNFKSFNFLEIFSDNNIDRIDFLKMDCEGSEYEIIPHLIKTDLIKKIDNISIELHGRDQKEYEITLDFLSKSYEEVSIEGKHLAHFRNLCI